MQTIETPTTTPVAPVAPTADERWQEAQGEYPAGGIGFDWLIAALSGWLIGGIHLDGWAHNHIPELETFFTPWHAAFYSGFFLLLLTLLVAFARNSARGYPWRRALPMGYGLSLAGGFLFLGGGVGDMLWHMAFGIEANIEALLSPTHLLLVTGGILMIGGPVRALWQRTNRRALPLTAMLPALLALALIVAVLAFFTQFAHPQVAIAAARGAADGNAADRGVAAILVQATLLATTALFLVRRWSLPFGSLTLIFGLPSILISFMHDRYAFIPAAILAGLFADALVRWLRPAPNRAGALHAFAFAVPVVYYALYFATLALTVGIAWRIHLWAGAIVMAGVVGLLLSYLITPPATPDQSANRG